MPLIHSNTAELEYDTPTPDGEFDAMLVKIRVEDAEETVEVPHGLGRIPKKIEIVWFDKPAIFMVNHADDGSELTTNEIAYLTFFEERFSIVLRFS